MSCASLRCQSARLGGTCGTQEAENSTFSILNDIFFIYFVSKVIVRGFMFFVFFCNENRCKDDYFEEAEWPILYATGPKT